MPVTDGYAEGVLNAGVGEAEARDGAQFGKDLGFLAKGIDAVQLVASLT